VLIANNTGRQRRDQRGCQRPIVTAVSGSVIDRDHRAVMGHRARAAAICREAASDMFMLG
jgi:hypothetical protein